MNVYMLVRIHYERYEGTAGGCVGIYGSRDEAFDEVARHMPEGHLVDRSVNKVIIWEDRRGMVEEYFEVCEYVVGSAYEGENMPFRV
jgi:hypothetical protein